MLLESNSMKTSVIFASVCFFVTVVPSQENKPAIVNLKKLAGEVQFHVETTNRNPIGIQASDNLTDWNILSTSEPTSSGLDFKDASTALRDRRFYRIRELAKPVVLTGDHLETTQGDIVIHPINHATFVLRWNDIMFYIDPIGGGRLFSRFPDPDFIFITHSHGDHFDMSTLSATAQESTEIYAPQIVYTRLSSTLRAKATVMANGDTLESRGITIEAIPAYNTTRGRLNYHPEGVGNGYILTLGGDVFTSVATPKTFQKWEPWRTSMQPSSA